MPQCCVQSGLRCGASVSWRAHHSVVMYSVSVMSRDAMALCPRSWAPSRKESVGRCVVVRRLISCGRSRAGCSPAEMRRVFTRAWFGERCGRWQVLDVSGPLKSCSMIRGAVVLHLSGGWQFDACARGAEIEWVDGCGSSWARICVSSSRKCGSKFLRSSCVCRTCVCDLADFQ